MVTLFNAKSKLKENIENQNQIGAAILDKGIELFIVWNIEGCKDKGIRKF